MNFAEVNHQWVESCLDHAIQRLDESETQLDPYPHFWIENIFPDEAFQQLLEFSPDDSFFQNAGEYEKHGETRCSMPLHAELFERMSSRQREFWYSMRAVLASTGLKQAIFSKLAPGLAIRFRQSEEQAARVTAFPRPILYRERSGYSIPPHPDTRSKIATVQFCMARDNSQTELGTSIYQLSLHPRDLIKEPRGFREVGRYPFLPNSVFAFSVLNSPLIRSWHGREALSEQSGIRNTLLQIYYAKPADGNQEMLPVMKHSA